MKLTYFFYCGIWFFAAFAGVPDIHSQDKEQSNTVWQSDYEKAAAEAKESGKDILIVFTGTDWIDICKKFDDDVLSSPEFTGELSKQFVLVKLEFAKESPKNPDKVTAQKQFIKSTYRVRGFPTVILTDAKGRLYAINGFQPVTAKDYAGMILKMFQEKQRKYDFLATAADLSGDEKASNLVKGIPKLPGNLTARFFRPEMDAVIIADPENKTGLVPEYKRLIADVIYSGEMAKLASISEWTRMLKISDGYISMHELKGATKQRVLMNKIGVYGRLKSNEGIITTLLQIVKEDPESQLGKKAQKSLDKYRADKLEKELVPKE